MYFDQPGGGQTAKLCNQVSLASCMVGYADALALAEQAGIDQRQVLELMANGTGGSGASKALAPKALDGDYKPGFMVEHLRKDIALALQRAEDLDVAMPGAETAFTLFDMLCQIGGSRMGTQALSLLYSDEATGAAAGLDWSLLNPEDYGAGDGCGCGHEHGDGCCGGHGEGHGDIQRQVSQQHVYARSPGALAVQGHRNDGPVREEQHEQHEQRAAQHHGQA